jgi:hypothetical protein
MTTTTMIQAMGLLLLCQLKARSNRHPLHVASCQAPMDVGLVHNADLHIR